MNYLLFDNSNDRGRLSFISKNLSIEVIEVFSPKANHIFVGWLKGVMNVLHISHNHDTIVCWYDFQAILCYWLGILTFRRRKIVCINLLLKDKHSIKNKLVSWLYKKALNSKNVVASVTSVEYGEFLKKRLGIDRKMFLVHDVFKKSYIVEKNKDIVPNSVFCGGRNGRDWGFMLAVAKAMPHVEFHLVMPEAVFHEYEHDLPNNVIARYNLPLDGFMQEMCSCEIVALPLDTEAPAGLIVLFQAAANKKYIITTDTMTTREYLSDGRGRLVPNDVASWKMAINDSLGGPLTNVEASDNLLHFLETECSEAKFVEGVEMMIKFIN